MRLSHFLHNLATEKFTTVKLSVDVLPNSREVLDQPEENLVRWVILLLLHCWGAQSVLGGDWKTADVGEPVEWGELCALVVARSEDIVTVQVSLSPANRRATQDWLEKSVSDLRNRRMTGRDRERLIKRIELNRKDLIRGYREYRLPLKNRSFDVPFAVPPLESRLRPQILLELPWMAHRGEWLFPESQRGLSLQAFSSVAFLSDLTQQRWAYLENDGWKLYRLAGVALPEASLPFVISPAEKKIILFNPDGSLAPQDKAVEGALAIGAIWEAYFRVRTTHAPAHLLMHEHFRNFSAKIFAELPQVNEVTKALAGRNHIDVGPSVTNMAYQTVKVLEMEKARALHLWLSLKLVEEAFLEASRVTQMEGLKESGKGPFTALIDTRFSTLGHAVRTALEEISAETLKGWD